MFILESHITSEIETLLKSYNVKCYPNYLPQKAAKPAVVYNLITAKTVKNVTKDKHRTATLQLTLMSDSYGKAKQLQQLIYDYFEFYDYQNTNITVLAEVVNVVDLFKNDLNQIAIDVSFEYIID